MGGLCTLTAITQLRSWETTLESQFTAQCKEGVERREGPVFPLIPLGLVISASQMGSEARAAPGAASPEGLLESTEEGLSHFIRMVLLVCMESLERTSTSKIPL